MFSHFFPHLRRHFNPVYMTGIGKGSGTALQMVDPVVQCTWFMPGSSEQNEALWPEMLQFPVSVQMHF